VRPSRSVAAGTRENGPSVNLDTPLMFPMVSEIAGNRRRMMFWRRTASVYKGAYAGRAKMEIPVHGTSFNDKREGDGEWRSPRTVLSIVAVF
jgi:hypothetical protein